MVNDRKIFNERLMEQYPKGSRIGFVITLVEECVH